MVILMEDIPMSLWPLQIMIVSRNLCGAMIISIVEMVTLEHVSKNLYSVMISMFDMATLMEDVSMSLWPLQIMIVSKNLCDAMIISIVEMVTLEHVSKSL
jgi:hypothetical protein